MAQNDLTNLNADPPDLSPAIRAVRRYVEHFKDGLSGDDVQILAEIDRRLLRLQEQAEDLLRINNRLGMIEVFKVNFDQATDTFSISFGPKIFEFRVNRADPDTPLNVRNLYSGSAYHAGTSEARDPETARLRLELEEKLESFYQSAHRVLKLCGQVTGLGKVECRPITIVRNKLIEHPEDGALYTFGFGSSGPRVKPMHRGDAEFNDEGLVPNGMALVTIIEDSFAIPK